MTPLIVTTVESMRQAVRESRARGQSVGLVPTMGALHAGHVSLMAAAKSACGFVVVSIFVNPTQFGPNEDFSRYPRPFEKDVELCAAEGVQCVFAPAPSVIYPPGFRTFVEVTQLQDGLCGASRPGHFRGVATVVLKLLNIVQPDVAYFGQKDYQQTRVLEQMVADLNVPTRLAVCPTLREPDGLALSSRNQYLDPAQRSQAPVLYQTLVEVQKLIRQGERRAKVLVDAIRTGIGNAPGARVDYIAIVDANTLEPLERAEGKVLVALAVFFGSTRLIDNVVIGGES
jgi:pantoate--beta-alanine ligase